MIWQRKSKNNTEIPVFPCSKVRNGYGSVLLSFLVPMTWKAASTRCLKFSPMPSTRPGKVMVIPLLSPGTKIFLWKWRTLAVAVLWIIMSGKSGITGNWSSVRCTPAANTAKTAKTMNIPWALTVWVPVLPSMRLNSLTPPSGGMDSGMTCILKRVEILVV